MGFKNFYEHFIPRNSHIAVSLTELAADNALRTDLKWSTKHDDTLRQVQTKLNNTPFMQLQDTSKPYVSVHRRSQFRRFEMIVLAMGDHYLPVRFTNRKLTPVKKIIQSNIWTHWRFV